MVVVVGSVVVVPAAVVVVRLVVVDVLPGFLADLVSALPGFVWAVVVVVGAPDVVVTFGVFVAFAVVFDVFGDAVAVGACEDETLVGAEPFPFEAASIGASVRHSTIAVPAVISTMRMLSPR